MDKFYDLKREGLNVSLIIPDFDYADITPFAENGNDTFKWVINYDK